MTGEIVEDDTDPQKAAAKAALDEWARAWAAHHGTGEAHAAAIRAWATPTHPEKPAPPPDVDTTDRRERVWAWGRRVTEAQGRVKERRGLTVYEQLPGVRTRHCGREGCPCTHGRYPAQGDYCDRGFIPTPGDRDGERETARCPVCRRHAQATKAVKGTP